MVNGTPCHLSFHQWSVRTRDDVFKLLLGNHYFCLLHLWSWTSSGTASRSRATQNVFFNKPSRMLFFISLVLTQMTSAFISMVILNSVAAMFFPVNFLEAMLYSTLLIFLALPVAFLSANLTMLHKSSYQTLSTVIAIIFFISLFTLTFEHMINYVNPLLYLSQILFMQGAFEYFVYVIGSALCIITGVYSLRNYRINSIMRR